MKFAFYFLLFNLQDENVKWKILKNLVEIYVILICQNKTSEKEIKSKIKSNVG